MLSHSQGGSDIFTLGTCSIVKGAAVTGKGLSWGLEAPSGHGEHQGGKVYILEAGAMP